MTEEKNKDLSSETSPAESSSDSAASKAKSSINTSSRSSSKASAFEKPHAKVTQPKAGSGKLLSILAILLSLVAISTVAALHWWQLQQQSQHLQENSRRIAQQFTDAKMQLSTQIDQQFSTVSQQVIQSNEQSAHYQQLISQLEQKVARLESRKPSEWVLHEAEYLIRVAGRAMWLEQDTKAAIALLKEANQRLQELSNPQYIEVRKVIHQDIEALSLVNQPNLEDIAMSVMALAEQVPQLPIAMAKVPESTEPEPSFELSEDITDWRENLSKSWYRFKEQFITVRRRSGNVEALMSPQYQQNLKENLALKLQQIQYAILKQHSMLFQASLQEVHHWLDDYFDLTSTEVNAFKARISELQQETIEVTLPSNLKALDAIRSLNGASDITTVEHAIDQQLAPEQGTSDDSGSNDDVKVLPQDKIDQEIPLSLPDDENQVPDEIQPSKVVPPSESSQLIGA